MKYSLFRHNEITYARDEDGNLIPEYEDEEGNIYYRQDGTGKDYYDIPVTFRASLNSKLNEMQAKEWGCDQSNIYSQIKIEKGILPRDFGFGTKIWYDSEVGWNSDGTVDESTADFTIKGVLTDRLQFDYYLLQRNNNA